MSILKPLAQFDLWKSRRFWTVVIGVIVSAILRYFPGLEGEAAELVDFLELMVEFLVGGYIIEDTFAAFRTGERNPKYKK